MYVCVSVCMYVCLCACTPLHAKVCANTCTLCICLAFQNMSIQKLACILRVVWRLFENKKAGQPPYNSGVRSADSTRISGTLAHLGQAQRTHRHSTESAPSFLTGLERERARDKVSKRERERQREREIKAGSAVAPIYLCGCPKFFCCSAI